MRKKKMSHSLEELFKSLRMSALIQVRSCDVYEVSERSKGDDDTHEVHVDCKCDASWDKNVPLGFYARIVNYMTDAWE